MKIDGTMTARPISVIFTEKSWPIRNEIYISFMVGNFMKNTRSVKIKNGRFDWPEDEVVSFNLAGNQNMSFTFYSKGGLLIADKKLGHDVFWFKDLLKAYKMDQDFTIYHVSQPIGTLRMILEYVPFGGYKNQPNHPDHYNDFFLPLEGARFPEAVPLSQSSLLGSTTHQPPTQSYSQQVGGAFMPYGGSPYSQAPTYQNAPVSQILPTGYLPTQASSFSYQNCHDPKQLLQSQSPPNPLTGYTF